MAGQNIAGLHNSCVRDPSPSGQSVTSESSGDDGPDMALAHRRKRSRHGFAKILPACLMPKSKRSVEKAFNQWKAKDRGTSLKLLLLLILLVVVIVVLIALLAYSIIHYRRLDPKNDIQMIVASWGRPGTASSSLRDYPTQFSQGIIPIPCHSHNDYTRKVPLYDALAAGCVSVEADVWFSPRDLLVGHTINSLTESRTLKSMYIDPLVNILSHQNPTSKPLAQSNDTSLRMHGIWDNAPTEPLILFIDVKNDPGDVYGALWAELEPFRSRGWLTSWDGQNITERLITVVASGEAPFDLITENTTAQDIFYDAPLADLSGENAPANGTLYNSTNSYYASTNFENSVGKLWHGSLAPKQVEVIRAQIREAHSRGLKVRYWNTPNWPRSSREHVWDVLEKEGVDMLNVDHLTDAAQRRW